MLEVYGSPQKILRLRDNIDVVGLVETAGVATKVIPLMVRRVVTITNWISSRQSTRDIISYIERACEQQDNTLCKSLDRTLNEILHPLELLGISAENAKMLAGILVLYSWILQVNFF